MVMDDSRPIEKWLVPIFSVCLVFTMIIRCWEDGGINLENTLIFLIIALVIVLFARLISANPHHYMVDEDGLTIVLHSKKKIFFAWNEICTFALYTASYAKAGPWQTVMILSENDLSQLPADREVKNINWYERRYKHLAAIKFTAERYEHIRRFCDLPLEDRRRKQ